VESLAWRRLPLGSAPAWRRHKVERATELAVAPAGRRCGAPIYKRFPEKGWWAAPKRPRTPSPDVGRDDDSRPGAIAGRAPIAACGSEGTEGAPHGARRRPGWDRKPVPALPRPKTRTGGRDCGSVGDGVGGGGRGNRSPRSRCLGEGGYAAAYVVMTVRRWGASRNTARTRSLNGAAWLRRSGQRIASERGPLSAEGYHRFARTSAATGCGEEARDPIPGSNSSPKLQGSRRRSDGMTIWSALAHRKGRGCTQEGQLEPAPGTRGPSPGVLVEGPDGLRGSRDDDHHSERGRMPFLRSYRVEGWGFRRSRSPFRGPSTQRPANVLVLVPPFCGWWVAVEREGAFLGQKMGVRWMHRSGWGGRPGIVIPFSSPLGPPVSVDEYCSGLIGADGASHPPPASRLAALGPARRKAVVIDAVAQGRAPLGKAIPLRMSSPAAGSIEGIRARVKEGDGVCEYAPRGTSTTRDERDGPLLGNDPDGRRAFSFFPGD